MKWVLVPEEATTAMSNAAALKLMTRHTTALCITAANAARPPIPRAKWDEMMERGARAWLTHVGIHPDATTWKGQKRWQISAVDFAVALRAALNNPKVADE